jgi:hypothetical protein
MTLFYEEAGGKRELRKTFIAGDSCHGCVPGNAQSDERNTLNSHAGRDSCHLSSGRNDGFCGGSGLYQDQRIVYTLIAS